MHLLYLPESTSECAVQSHPPQKNLLVAVFTPRITKHRTTPGLEGEHPSRTSNFSRNPGSGRIQTTWTCTSSWSCRCCDACDTGRQSRTTPCHRSHSRLAPDYNTPPTRAAQSDPWPRPRLARPKTARTQSWLQPPLRGGEHRFANQRKRSRQHHRLSRDHADSSTHDAAIRA